MKINQNYYQTRQGIVKRNPAQKSKQIMIDVSFRCLSNDGSISIKGIWFEYNTPMSQIDIELSKYNYLFLERVTLVDKITKNPLSYTKENINPTNSEKVQQIVFNLTRINKRLLKKSRDQLITKLIALGEKPAIAINIVDNEVDL